MAFKFPVRDWWSERGWLSVSHAQERLGLPISDNLSCIICDSRRGLAVHPEHYYVVCELHSHCSVQGALLISGLRVSGTKIVMEKWKSQPLNSWDRDAIIPYMDDEVLLENVRLTLANCRKFDPPASTYDEAIQLYAAELASRLKPKQETPHEDISIGL